MTDLLSWFYWERHKLIEDLYSILTKLRYDYEMWDTNIWFDQYVSEKIKDLMPEAMEIMADDERESNQKLEYCD